MSRGRLRIYLGAAPGVGKTYAMLDEARRRHERGTDVVVAYADTRGRPRTAAMLQDLEIVPRRTEVGGGLETQELDLEEVLARRPAVAVVDDLAHRNAPGSRHRHRHEDVEELLAHGIDVLATVGIESLESLQDVVERIVGERPTDVIPDDIVRGADQVELVDMTPEALRRRVVHGNVVPVDHVDAALGGRFRPDHLAALRELALLWVADQVDETLHDHDPALRWETRERVVVALTGAPTGDRLVRRAARLARRSTAELLGVHVLRPGHEVDQATLEEHRRLLSDLGGRYHEVVGTDVPVALCDFARARNATQLVLGATRRSRWAELRRGSVVSAVLRAAGDLDIHVIGDEPGLDDHDEPMIVRPPRRRPHLSGRRRALAAGFALLTVVLLAVVLDQLHPQPNLPTDLLLFLLVVLVSALLGGFAVGVTTAAVSAVVVTWFLTPPVHTLSVDGAADAVALATFFVVSVAVSALVSRMARQSADAIRARVEAEGLARAAGSLVAGDDAAAEIVDALCVTFDRTGVVLALPDRDGWRIEARAGAPIEPAALASDAGARSGLDPADGISLVELPGGARLVHAGPPLNDDEQRVLAAFAAQLGNALERRRLEAEAAAQGDRLRTAILRAVSHDLRTPLASIKASATTLLQDDIDWTPDAQREFLEAIDEEADRLDTVVGDLLDLSRLEAGVVRPTLSPVGLDEVVHGALASLSETTTIVVRDVPTTLPLVLVDPALLQRRARPRGRARVRRRDGWQAAPRRHPRRRAHRGRQPPCGASAGAGRCRRPGSTVTTVLVVDDEPQIRRALAANLKARDYEVLQAATGEEALRLVAERRPDVVILDIGLPGMDGIEVVHGLRGWSDVPIIMLSVRRDEGDKVEALDAGADDYLTKPFGMGELLARVRAALRRVSATEVDPVIDTGSLHIDLAAKRVQREGTDIHLTPTEWGLVDQLARNQGKLVTQRQLLQAVWGPEYGTETHYLRVYMAALRRKLEDDPSCPRHFLTEPGMGYRFEV